MALPVYRRFSIQDIPNAPNWAEQVFVPLNLFCETSVAAMNKNLTIGDNVQGMKYSVSFVTPADYATGGFNTIVFNYTSNGQPNNLIIGSIARNDGALMLSPISINKWTLNINTSPAKVTVDYIAGLAASTKYNVNFLVI
jgi:hypothetical protein